MKKNRGRERVLPAVRDRDNTGTVLGNLEKHGHREIKMGSGRVAPSTIVARLGKVRWAKIGSGYKNGRTTRVAPLRVTCTFYLVTGSAALPIVE